MDWLALWIGYVVLVVGGVLLAVIVLAVAAWSAFEVVANQYAWTKLVWAWREERQRGSGPPA
jgi:hypothetical protein